MTRVMLNHISVCLEIVLVSVQNMCTVCAKHSIGLETVLDTLMVLLGDKPQVKARFSPFGGSANLDAR